jgi:hypothetical protein
MPGMDETRGVFFAVLADFAMESMIHDDNMRGDLV